MRFVSVVLLSLAFAVQSDAGPLCNLFSRLRSRPACQPTQSASVRPLLGYGEYVVVAGRQFGYTVHTTPPFVSVQTGQRFVMPSASSCPGGNCPLPSATLR